MRNHFRVKVFLSFNFYRGLMKASEGCLKTGRNTTKEGTQVLWHTIFRLRSHSVTHTKNRGKLSFLYGLMRGRCKLKAKKTIAHLAYNGT